MISHLCLEQNKVAALRFAQTSVEEREKTYKIEKQQNIVLKKECIKDFQRVFEK